MCRCHARDPYLGEPPIHDQRALADAVGDLVAEATEDHSETDRCEAIEKDAEMCHDTWLLRPAVAGEW